MALFALVQNLITRLPGWVTCIATLPWIVLLALSVSIGLVSPSARVTSVKFTLGPSVTETGPQGHLGPIKNFASPEQGWPSADWALGPWEQNQMLIRFNLQSHSHCRVSNELPRFYGEFPDALPSSISNLEDSWFNTDFPNWAPTLRPNRICSGCSGSLFWSRPQNSR